MIILADGMDVSSYISTITWSGDISQMARKLSFDYLYTDLSRDIIQIEISVGSRILMRSDSGELLFDGIVIIEEFDEAEVKKSIQAADYAFYLKSEVYGEFKGTPAEVASMVLGMFGIEAGQLLDADGEINIVATGDKTIYQILTEAYASVGEGINIYMTGTTVNIEKAGARPAGVVTGDESVISAKYKSSMENMINRVAIINASSELMINADSEDVQYGIVQKVYKHDEEGKDAMEEAKKLFHSLENSGSITVRGNVNYTAGRSIIVEKVNSRIQGLFIVTSDSHTFSSGQHTASLTLDFLEVV